MADGDADPAADSNKQRLNWPVIAMTAALTALVSGLIGIPIAVVAGLVTVPAQSAISGFFHLSPPTSSPCPEATSDAPRVGEDYIEVYVRDARRPCWERTLDSIRPGDRFQVRLQYANHTKTQQDDVSLRISLPDGFNYVAGSTEIANSTTAGKYKRASDGLTTVGYNAGSYQADGNVYMKFSAEMSSDIGNLCGLQAWAIAARATTNAAPEGLLAVTGLVTVNKSCG